MMNSRKNSGVNGPKDKIAAQATSSTEAPVHHAWGWKLVILLSSLWVGLAVGLLSSGR
ncbi:MAG: hypothetical protein H7095_05270 [Pseudopedobacter sp.]|nr:hypothetical protein [Deinococcales bacterium]